MYQRNCHCKACIYPFLYFMSFKCNDQHSGNLKILSTRIGPKNAPPILIALKLVSDILHYQDRLHYLWFHYQKAYLLMCLPWCFDNLSQLSTSKVAPLTDNVEVLRNECEEQYHEALQMLEKTGDLASFTCNVSFVKYLFPSNFEQP